MDSDEKHISSIKEGVETPEGQTDAQPNVDSGVMSSFIEDIEEFGGLQRKPQDTRVTEGQKKDPPPSNNSFPMSIQSNFAESAPIAVVVRDVPTAVKEFMSKTGRTLDRCSRSLELLSFLAMAACMWFGGAKYHAKEMQDAIVFASLAVVFLNNGVRIPNSLAGQVINRMTRIKE